MDRIASADACDDLQNGQFGKRAGEMPGLVLTCLISIIGPRSEVVSSSCERYAADRTLRAPICGGRLFVKHAAVAQLAEHHVANVIVVGSNPISRSFFLQPTSGIAGFLWLCGFQKPVPDRLQVQLPARL